jgi:DNA repair exonuclease SbcCD ATPase subunit
MINHSLTSNSINLHAVKENLKSIKDDQNGLKVEMAGLTRKLSELENGVKVGLQRLETDLARGRKCPFCGKDVLPQFKLCPYCGEKLPYALMQIETL